jgi:DNA-binding NarL/FixJ family response regulator
VVPGPAAVRRRGVRPERRSEGWPVTVVRTAVTDPGVVRSVFPAGVPGYVLTAGPLTTRTADRGAALSGTGSADPGTAGGLARGLLRTGVEEAVGALSDRERDVLRLVADGYTNEEVGEKVDLSALTVPSRPARTAREPGTGDRARTVAPGSRSGVVR